MSLSATTPLDTRIFLRAADALPTPVVVEANTQEIAGSSALSDDEAALVVLDPAQSSALVVAAFGQRAVGVEPDFIALVEALDESMARVRGGDLSDIEDALVAQAASLQAIFTALSVRVLRNFEMSQAGSQWLKLALRAQSQARATMDTLAGMKRPATPPIFARQANFAAGHQQVNNHGARPTGAQTGCARCAMLPATGRSIACTPTPCPHGCDLV